MQEANMSLSAKSGYSHNGLPYKRSGHGPRPLVIVQGLTFEHTPQAIMLMMYKFLENDYTLYGVLRKPQPPHGYTLGDMADDCAVMIREEFGGPVDVLGLSTGGSIVQHLAADHPDLVRRLIIHSSAHTLNAMAKTMQLEIGRLAQQGQWRKAWAILIRAVLPQTGIAKWLSLPLVWLSATLLSLNAPKDPSDVVVTVEAEDKFAFKDRLAEIAAPTLVAAGGSDPFYTPALFRETAEGIPNGKLCLYENKGHPAGGKQFRRDVLAFLRGESPYGKPHPQQ
jgi:pimeloyl-ACP methyl ester carboxylesterase